MNTLFPLPSGIPAADELAAGFGGFTQLHQGYDALSALLDTADAATLDPVAIAFLLHLLNERFAACLAVQATHEMKQRTLPDLPVGDAGEAAQQ